jgi:glutathione S-transferase
VTAVPVGIANTAPMKLHFAPTSPYVRKCMVVADELGLSDRITLLASSAHPVNRDASIIANNPLGKVPTLVTDDGMALYDSRVICEYLNDLGGGQLFPASGAARWRAMTLQSLGDGILDAALLTRYENMVRPEALRWAEWTAGKLDAIHTSLSYLNQHPSVLAGELHIGQITVACALKYLDFRFPELAWNQAYPALAQAIAPVLARESVKKERAVPA